MSSRDHRVIALGLLVERESRDAIRALKEKGVRPILLKGPLQQAWLEPAGAPRTSTDVDVLVSRDQLETAGLALGALGYGLAPALPENLERKHLPDRVEHGYHQAWIAEERTPVELHWSLGGADENKAWDVLSRETETADLMGEEVELPNEAARCAIVALHAAQHGIGQPVGFRDLEKALIVAGIETWRRAAELAAAMGGWPLFAVALSFSPRGADLLRDMGREPSALEVRQAISFLTPAPTSLGFYFLSRQSGVRAKAGFALAELAPPPAFMHLCYPLARRGRIGLALAYLYRSYWLARWVVPGLRSFRDAQRLAEVSRTNASEKHGSS
jgi:Uncharacterised nucleotidyltransferase